MPCPTWFSRRRAGLAWAALAVLALSTPVAGETVPPVSELLAAGARARSAGQMVVAAGIYKRILDLEPGHRLAAYNAGIILENAGRPVLAAGVWRQALAADPGDLFAYEHLARDLALGGGLDEELAQLEDRVQRHPEAQVPRLQQALALAAAGRRPEAVAVLEQLLMEYPSANIAYTFLKDSFSRSAAYQAYVEDVNRRALLPDAPEALRLLAVRLLLERGQAAAALAFAAGVTWQSEDSRRLLTRAGVLQEGGAAMAVAAPPAPPAESTEDTEAEPPAAEEEKGPSAPVAPAMPELPARPAPEAEEALPDFGPADPRSASRYEQESRLALSRRDDAAALAALQRAVESAPLRLQPRIVLALLLEQEQRPGAARAVLRGPVEASPWDVYQQGWRAVRDDYIDADYAGADIFALRQQAAQEVRSLNDAKVALQVLLDRLEDRYAYLFPPERFAGYLLAPNAGAGAPKVTSAWVPVPQNFDDGEPSMPLSDPRAHGSVTPEESQPLAPAPVPSTLPGLDDVSPGTAGADHRLQVKPSLRETRPVPDGDERNRAGDTLRQDPAVRSVRLAGGVGYLAIPSLAALDVPRQVELALAGLAGSRHLVVDLRGNRGGDGEVAVDVASLFLDPGDPVCAYQTRRGREVRRSRGGSVLRPQGELAVLIDSATASAAELLAAALRESADAVLVGEQSSGKGVGQRALLLPDGSGMSLTRFRLLSPQGLAWDGRGLSPDLAIATASPLRRPADQPDTALAAAATLLRARQP